MARTPFPLPPPPGSDPTHLSAADAVRCLLRVGATGGALVLTQIHFWNYLLIAHPAWDRLGVDLSQERHTRRLRSKAKEGIRQLVETGELVPLKLPAAYKTGGFRWVFWSGKHDEIPDCYPEIWKAWDEARNCEAEHEIVTLAEHAPTVKHLSPQALAAELVLSDTLIAEVTNSSRLGQFFGGVKVWERTSRWIDKGTQIYLAASRRRFNGCDGTFESCVPTVGDSSDEERVMDALRASLLEARANGNNLCIYVPYLNKGS